MRGFAYVLAALAVFGLAFWAYRENYATQQVLKETRALQTADRRGAGSDGRVAGRMGLSQPARPAGRAGRVELRSAGGCCRCVPTSSG